MSYIGFNQKIKREGKEKRQNKDTVLNIFFI